ncbi:hypothetical protein PanWU01x14_275190 [Parasponia andersonii]|uniref:Uncharacterized protein n=1 Tax=Parasponia andersonii TaxID=3476 RepID=A0A2P5B3F9_PARAD|nr:hypothetical protein PanWU01x14_275190 [Parasponia andersonii]
MSWIHGCCLPCFRTTTPRAESGEKLSCEDDNGDESSRLGQGLGWNRRSGAVPAVWMRWRTRSWTRWTRDSVGLAYVHPPRGPVPRKQQIQF